MNRFGRKRIVADLPIAFYNHLKKIAEKRNITITKLLIRMIFNEMRR